LRLSSGRLLTARCRILAFKLEPLTIYLALFAIELPLLRFRDVPTIRSGLNLFLPTNSAIFMIELLGLFFRDLSACCRSIVLFNFSPIASEHLCAARVITRELIRTTIRTPRKSDN
jgi:hypothetical protein